MSQRKGIRKWSLSGNDGQRDNVVLFLGRSVKQKQKNEQVVNCLGILENLRVNPTGKKRRKYYIHFYTAILYIHYI